jgi:hypothetical protein
VTKRQKLIAYWLACFGSAAVAAHRKGYGSPAAECGWSGFDETGDDPEPTIEEINAVLAILSAASYT